MPDLPYDYAPGATAVLTLVVTPGDSGTAGTVLVTSPAGVTSAPAVTGTHVAGVWTGQASLQIATAGIWDIRWTVTGMGAGVRYQRISAGPAVPITGRRTYANSEDLAKWLEDDPPIRSAQLLRDATREIDKLLLTAIYDVDDDGMPTDPDVIAALRDAVCAQVEWWEETGDSLGAMAQLGSASIGSVSLSAGGSGGGSGGSGTASKVAVAAVDILQLAGLTGQGPQVW